MDYVSFFTKIIDKLLDWKTMFLLAVLFVSTVILHENAGLSLWLSVGIALFIGSMVSLVMKIQKDKKEADTSRKIKKAYDDAYVRHQTRVAKIFK